MLINVRRSANENFTVQLKMYQNEMRYCSYASNTLKIADSYKLLASKLYSHSYYNSESLLLRN